MSAPRNDEILREAQKLALFASEAAARVSSPNREVTVAVGVGGTLRALELSAEAYRWDGRGLSRLIMTTILTADGAMRTMMAEEFGDRAGLAEPDLRPGEPEEFEDHDTPVVDVGSGVEALRNQLERRQAGVARLAAEVAGARFAVEADGVRVLFLGTALEGLAIEDPAVRPGLAEVVLSLYRAASARAGQYLAEGTAECTGAVDVRALVASYGGGV